jgi:hypothetical protein
MSKQIQGVTHGWQEKLKHTNSYRASRYAYEDERGQGRDCHVHNNKIPGALKNNLVEEKEDF